MSTVLITGGCGFVGTHLCRALRGAKHSVRVIDIVRPASPVPGVEYLLGSILDAERMASAVKGVDAVFHLAALVSVPLCEAKAVESYETNLIGTCQVLNAIRFEKVHCGKPIRLIFSSTAAVYPDLGATDSALREDGPAVRPLSLYALQKLASEQLIFARCDKDGIPAVIFRFFNIYGPGQDPLSPYSGVISKFSRAIALGEDLALEGGGGQSRDFISVHDIVSACVFALGLAAAKCDALPMNLAGGTGISIRNLAQLMMEVGGRVVGTRDTPSRDVDILHSVADITKARRVLGWTPRISLTKGLAELHTSLFPLYLEGVDEAPAFQQPIGDESHDSVPRHFL